MDPWLLELIGYIASVLVAVSLMMSSIVRLRVINLLGSITFAIYGVLIAAYPVAVVNTFIAFINIYYLRGMLVRQEFFRLLPLSSDSEYLHYFLSFYQDEIRRFMPEAGRPQPDSLVVSVLRDTVPAGLLAGRIEGDILHVDIDFVIPAYRDFKVGRFLFEDSADYFRTRGVRQIIALAGNKEHRRYLERMGFAPVQGSDEKYQFTIDDYS
jgi:GNAT superfamily N-acetyltransferase